MSEIPGRHQAPRRKIVSIEGMFALFAPASSEDLRFYWVKTKVHRLAVCITSSSLESTQPSYIRGVCC